MGHRNEPDVRGRTDRAGAVAIHSVRWAGAARRVVLVHGMVVAGRSMFALAAELAGSGCEVWVPDLPGFGVSDKPRRPLDVEETADVLAEWMEALHLEGCTVVGNSFGTQIAAALAERHPVRAAHLVLVGPTIDERWRRLVPRSWRRRPARPPISAADLVDRRRRFRRAVQQRLAAPRVMSGASPPSLRALIVTEYLSAGPRRVLATYRSAITDRMEKRLPGIEVPVLVVRGGEDPLASAGWARRLAALAPAGQMIEVAGVGHDGCFQNPGEIAAVILDACAPTDAMRRR